MPDYTAIQRIAELTEKIGKLPKGYICRKTVHGNVYFYHQWSEGGVKKSKYLRNEEIAGFTEQIELRKKLQKELAKIKASSKTVSEAQTGSVATLKLIQCNNAPDTPLTMNTPPC